MLKTLLYMNRHIWCNVHEGATILHFKPHDLIHHGVFLWIKPMPTFSDSSKSKLLNAHVDLQTLFNEVVKNFDCTILESFRNEEDQEKAYKEGKSKLQWPNGKHNNNPSLAVDVVPYPINFSDIKRIVYFSGFVLGIANMLKAQGKISHDIRWGGDWNRDNNLSDNTFNDLVHFEIVL